MKSIILLGLRKKNCWFSLLQLRQESKRGPPQAVCRAQGPESQRLFRLLGCFLSKF